MATIISNPYFAQSHNPQDSRHAANPRSIAPCPASQPRGLWRYASRSHRLVFFTSRKEICQWKELEMEETQSPVEEALMETTPIQSGDLRPPAIRARGKYDRELEVAVRAVQLACALCQRVQDRLLKKEEKISSKDDSSFVTVAGERQQMSCQWAAHKALPAKLGNSVSLGFGFDL
eukprot:Gb_25876 [translate_table: standard]